MSAKSLRYVFFFLLTLLRRPAALIQKLPIGRGALLVCTFKLKGQIGQNPLATGLFDELLGLL